ncbi:hypothetical protein BGZ61DRAFT_108630 [Ilyonectria robusta]|uniref:uncharacterized protein n=1 Tax=Ilyonectria robusta TaxID=1079257 RepID=UPI001E8CA282|nr:uncharacterized protein BGZ61DRAFT_108630 [Ilyonectria robusta]KAH8670619.1 hypothetical protein BGZ61DRAFT_108630 [Ilyonectria robusta]
MPITPRIGELHGAGPITTPSPRLAFAIASFSHLHQSHVIILQCVDFLIDRLRVHPLIGQGLQSLGKLSQKIQGDWNSVLRERRSRSELAPYWPASCASCFEAVRQAVRPRGGVCLSSHVAWAAAEATAERRKKASSSCSAQLQRSVSHLGGARQGQRGSEGQAVGGCEHHLGSWNGKGQSEQLKAAGKVVGMRFRKSRLHRAGSIERAL